MCIIIMKILKKYPMLPFFLINVIRHYEKSVENFKTVVKALKMFINKAKNSHDWEKQRWQEAFLYGNRLSNHDNVLSTGLSAGTIRGFTTLHNTMNQNDLEESKKGRKTNDMGIHNTYTVGEHTCVCVGGGVSPQHSKRDFIFFWLTSGSPVHGDGISFQKLKSCED